MTSTAKKSRDLAKRVRRFLLRERRRDEVLARLLDCLDSCEDVYLFGGILRDIALFGISQLDSDIDLVYLGATETIGAVVTRNGFKFKENKFGGLRVETKYWFVDIWGAKDTWAFRQGGRKYAGAKSLLGTTITNWESILYHLNERRLIHERNYLRDLNDRYLHVVYEENPNPLGMYVRIMRAYACKEASMLSNTAARVLNDALKSYSFEDINMYERNHYEFQYIAREVYEHFVRHVHRPDLLPVQLRKGAPSLL